MVQTREPKKRERKLEKEAREGRKETYRRTRRIVPAMICSVRSGICDNARNSGIYAVIDADVVNADVGISAIADKILDCPAGCWS